MPPPTPPGTMLEQATSLLYAGEMFDFDNQHYYNRARWYNPSNGRFNRTDPYAGNSQDPQSLHKYLYCHANPINGIDPTGETFISFLCVTMLIGFITSAIIGGIKAGTIGGALLSGLIGALFAPIFAMAVIAGGIGIAAAFGFSTVAGLAIAFGIAISASLAWSTYEFLTAKNDRERLAAGVSILFTVGFAIFGAYKFSKVSSLPSSAKSSGVLPKSKGATGQFISEAMALIRGEKIVGREVTIKSKSGIRIRADLLVRTLRGKLKLIESKFGSTAKLSKNQKAGYNDIVKYGGTIRGNSCSDCGLKSGTVIGPTDCQIDVWNGPN